MFANKYARLTVLILKLAIDICIIACLCWPITIRRISLKPLPDDFQTTFVAVPFRFDYHFCIPPEAKTVNVNSDDIVAVLNLPNGSEFSETLGKFGQCRAKLKKLQQVTDNFELCSCGQHQIYIIAVGVSICSAAWLIAQMMFGPWRKPSINGAVLAVTGGLLRFTTATLTLVLHSFWQDDVWLPDAMYVQSYFQRPHLWTSAVILNFVHVSVTVFEAIGFAPPKKPTTIGSDLKDSRESESLTDAKETVKRLCFVCKHDIDDEFTEENIACVKPLPKPKLANFEMMPPKPDANATWP